MSDWRNDPITEKQKELIQDAMEFSPYPIPPFKGTTKGEASEWIRKYAKKAMKSTWAIEHGYD